MSAHSKPCASADSQIILFQSSCTKTVRFSWSGVRCASSQPSQSLYLSMVLSTVGRPSRQEAMVANSSSYWGRYFSAQAFEHLGVIMCQSSNVFVCLSNQMPQGASVFSMLLL